MTIHELSVQITKRLSQEGVKEFANKVVLDGFERMCQRFRPGYKDAVKSEVWTMAQQIHVEYGAKLRGLVSAVLTEQVSAGKLVLTDREHVDGDGRPTGVVRQGDVLRSLVDLLNEIKDDRDVPATTRAQVYQSLLRVAEQIDIEQTEVVVEDFSEAWPSALGDAARELDVLAGKCVELLSGGRRSGEEGVVEDEG